MSTTYTLTGYSFAIDEFGQIAGGVSPSFLVLTGSADLQFELAALEGGLLSLDVAAGTLDEIRLDGTPVNLADESTLLLLVTYARGGTVSQTALIVQDNGVDPTEGTVVFNAFTVSGAGLTNSAQPNAAELQLALDTVPQVDPALGSLQPGVPFGLGALPGIVIEGDPVEQPISDIQGTPEAELLSGDDGADSIEGGAGNDGLQGRGGNDLLFGGAGNDTISSSTGDDLARGGDGDDRMGGGPGNDTMQGEAGSDFMGGGLGDDLMSGGTGNDVVNGGAGNDTLTGDDGDDTMGASFGNDSVEGNAGNDALGGGAGADTLRGGLGDDSLGGGAGRDLVLGGDGADFLAGGAGDDTLRGGAGADTLTGGAGDDSLRGEAGADLFIFNGADAGAVDTITDFTIGTDLIRLTGVAGGFAALDIAQGAAGAVLGYGGQEIVLEGVEATLLSADDFVFV